MAYRPPRRTVSTSGPSIITWSATGKQARRDDLITLAVVFQFGLLDGGTPHATLQAVDQFQRRTFLLDATTGQNGLTQARIFAEVVDITGIGVTKLAGSAKGGIVVSVQRELGVPVKFIGLGEGADDLAPFDAEQFVDGLLGD